MEVKVRDVSFSYDDKLIIDNFSCEFKSNKISAFVGGNGSGKSTLLKLIDGLLVPINGYVKLGSVNFSVNNSYPCRGKVGFLFQFVDRQIFNKSVYDEIKVGYKGLDFDKRVIDVINMVGLNESFLYKDPYKISSSERRRLGLACVLIHDPDVVILDEPFIGLDSRGKNDFLRLIKVLKKDFGKTIIVVSQDVDFLHKFVDYVYLIKDGSIFLEGDKYDVFSNELAMKSCGLKVPDVLHFSNLVLENKNVKIGYRDEINDLIKDVYRYVK